GRMGRAGVAITFAEPREQRMLRNIELLTKQKIEIAAVPTVADLRERRLAGEFSVMDVAAAAVKRAESPAGEKEEAEIPSAAERPGSSARSAGPRASLERSRPPKQGSSRSRPGELAGIYIGGGRKLKIRPGDIVGAIVNEAKLSPE